MQTLLKTMGRGALNETAVRSFALTPRNSAKVLVEIDDTHLRNIPPHYFKKLTPTQVHPQVFSKGALQKVTAAAPAKKPEKLEYTFQPMKPSSEGDFEVFRKIITDKNVMFTSIWMERAFGADFRAFLHEKYDLKIETREAVEQAVRKDPAASKTIEEALIPFFKQKESEASLREKFMELTKHNETLGLGYNKIIDKKTGELIGGGGAIPLDDKAKTIDACLHILPGQQRSGIGKDAMEKILKHAFEKGVGKAVGTSILNHPGMGGVLDQLDSGYNKKNNRAKNETTYTITAEMWEKKNTPSESNNASDRIFNSRPGSQNLGPSM